MTLTICIEDKTCRYDKEKNSDIKETANKADTSAVTVKILIYEAEDYTLVINTSAEGTSVISSSLSTFLSGSIFHFS